MNDSKNAGSFIDGLVLNDVQREAVVYDGGPQLVFAGAGTGKTRVLTAKIAYLIKHTGVYPYNIFAATFTNKAAAQMRERIEQITGIPSTGLWIGTFHSMCARILRREAHTLGYTPAFSIYDDADQLSVIKKVMKLLHIEERTAQPKHLLNIISRYKNACIPCDELEGTGRTFFEKETINVYGHYQRELKAAMAMDFDDLITNVIYLFRKHPAVLEAYQNQFKNVLVDEYQDTNLAQFYLVRFLAQKHKRIFVVGDDDQSIYSWRGAKIENILSFDKQFPGTKTYTLEQNYRSSQTVLDFANSVISTNKTRAQKKLWTSKSGGSAVVVTRYLDDRQEAASIALKIMDLGKKNIPLGDVAVLYRTNAQSRVFEEVLRKNNIRYILVGGISFYERKEIKDAIAYLRLLANPKDSISCERILNVPARGIGEKTQERLAALAAGKGCSMFEVIMAGDAAALEGRAGKGLEEFRQVFIGLRDLAAKGAPPDEILSQMLSDTGYTDLLAEDDSEESRARLENINELLNALVVWSDENPGKTLSDFLEEVSLAADIDGWKQNGDAANMMTLHSAKGLEFRTVFLVGLEDGLIPSRQNFDDESKIEEECRLFYVGSTRARESLECSHVNNRLRFGMRLDMEPSRFISCVPASLYRFVDRSMDCLTPPRPAFQSRAGAPVPVRIKKDDPVRQPVYDDFSQETVQYRMGQLVMHGKYGRGKVLAISGFGPDLQVTVLFQDGNRRRMMAKFANLQAL